MGRLPALARVMQNVSVMQLRTRPDAFIRSMVAAATVGPFLSALRDMKQARVRSARPVTPALEPAPMMAPKATPKAA